ncbi:MAG: oxidoreductase [Alphaproteobacteria bacterium]|nr:oxidoreductase [Alphaproteobacteria bacterium]
MTDSFRAIVLEEAEKGCTLHYKDLTDADLPTTGDGDVTVRVTHSTLNYKDGMVMGGIGRLVRQYPHVPGVDFSGVVEASDHPDYKAGDEVILTGWRVGEWHWGGYAGKARVKGDWLVPCPKEIGLERAMAVGTAGFTAMLAVIALEKHGAAPDKGELLVTGGAGGVGSVAVSILAKLGYDVAASTGRPEQAEYLKALGAKTIIDRAELSEEPKRPLNKERFQSAIDNVGGGTMANVLTQIAYRGSVAAVGLAGGNVLNTTVLPFLLRGVNILGIDSVLCPKEERMAAWSRLATDLPFEALDSTVTKATLDDLPDLGKAILKGQVRGRTVVEIG